MNLVLKDHQVLLDQQDHVAKEVQMEHLVELESQVVKDQRALVDPQDQWV